MHSIKNEDKIFFSKQKSDEAEKFYNSGDYNGAINLCNRAIELNYKNSKAYLIRGFSNIDMAHSNRVSEDTLIRVLNAVFKDFESAAQYETNTARSYAYLAIAWQTYSEIGEAVARRNGKNYDYKGDYNLKFAVKYYDQAIQLDSNNSYYHFNRGRCHMLLKNFDKSIYDFSKVIQINKSDCNAYINRGLSYAYLKNKDKSMNDFEKAIQLKPKDGSVYYWRGIGYNILGKKKKANADFKKARQLGFEF